MDQRPPRVEIINVLGFVLVHVGSKGRNRAGTAKFCACSASVARLVHPTRTGSFEIGPWGAMERNAELGIKLRYFPNS
jgi:hypothetical protein